MTELKRYTVKVNHPTHPLLMKTIEVVEAKAHYEIVASLKAEIEQLKSAKLKPARTKREQLDLTKAEA